MVTSCEIKFDNNPNGTYLSGQMITGKVILNLSEKKKVRSVYLKIEGYAKCSWTVTKGRGNGRRSITYKGREDYLNQVTYLLGTESGPNLDLAAGITTYSFACMLPESLPSSFEGKYGHIRYSCKAVLDRPLKTDKEFRLPFSVIKSEDLNAIPSLTIPTKSEIIRHFYCCCFKSKPFYMSAAIPFSGYVPGQKVDLIIFMNNQSNVDVEGTKVTLERSTQYISQNPRKKIRSELLAVKEVYGTGMIKSGSGEVRISLEIPPLSPTNINYSRIITTCYQLRVVAKVSGAHKNPYLNIPIKIGTNPLLASLPIPQYNTLFDASFSSQPSAPSISHPMDLPPPSYEEATQIVPEMSVDDANISIFNPRYPVWNFSSQMPTAPIYPAISPIKVPLN
ncbi:hypothetical protein ACKWTF_009150 [Chironomus riparius]